MLTRPKGALLLACMQMWRFFSHYGVRAILVLYMVDRLKFSDHRAFGISALFCGLVELGGIFGGVLADRYLGLRRAVMLGTPLMALGYLGLMVEKGLFFALSLVILGGSLFWSNLTALFGECFEKDDPRRQRGFTLFYMLQNLGALAAVLVCGYIAKVFGYRVAFAIAGSGMVINTLMLLWLPKTSSPARLRKEHSLWMPLGGVLVLGAIAWIISQEWIVLPLLPWVTIIFFLFFGSRLWRDQGLSKEKMRLLWIYLGALILFFAVEDQICSSLIVFAEKETNQRIFGWTIPSSVVMAMNPVVIILFGTLVTKISQKMKFLSLILPFLLISAGFGVISQLTPSILGISGIIVTISIAELMIGPVVMSFASELASEKHAGVVMGMIPISYSLAYLLAGGLSKMVAASESYGSGFGKLALLILGAAIALAIMIKRLSYEKKDPIY